MGTWWEPSSYSKEPTSAEYQYCVEIDQAAQVIIACWDLADLGRIRESRERLSELRREVGKDLFKAASRHAQILKEES